MIARLIYFPLLLLLVGVCSGRIPGSVRVRSIFSSSQNDEEPLPTKKPIKTVAKRPIKSQNTVMQQLEAAKNEVQQRINRLTKDSETLASEAVIRAEETARERLEQLEQAAATEVLRLSEEAANHANEKLNIAEQALLSKLSELEQDAMDEAQRRAYQLEMAARDRLLSIEQAAESKIKNLFNQMFPPKVVPLVPFMSDNVFETLFKALISLVLISAFGNLSGQMKAWDVWEELDSAFGDQYFPFQVRFMAKRTLAGVLDLVAVGLLTIPNSARDITVRLGSAIVALMSGRAAFVHDGDFMFIFSGIMAIVASLVFLNDFWLVPAKELTRSPRTLNEKKHDVQITVAVVALILILKRTLTEESFRDRFDSVFHRSKRDKKRN